MAVLVGEPTPVVGGVDPDPVLVPPGVVLVVDDVAVVDPPDDGDPVRARGTGLARPSAAGPPWSVVTCVMSEPQAAATIVATPSSVTRL
jgi:hypothetical protein